MPGFAVSEQPVRTRRLRQRLGRLRGLSHAPKTCRYRSGADRKHLLPMPPNRFRHQYPKAISALRLVGKSSN